MDSNGNEWMLLKVYSSLDDDRSGIAINLHFRINDSGDDNNPSITLIEAEREAYDHEWEPDSTKKLSVRKVTTLDALIELVEKNAKPKGKKPKA